MGLERIEQLNKKIIFALALAGAAGVMKLSSEQVSAEDCHQIDPNVSCDIDSNVVINSIDSTPTPTVSTTPTTRREFQAQVSSSLGGQPREIIQFPDRINGGIARILVTPIPTAEPAPRLSPTPVRVNATSNGNLPDLIVTSLNTNPPLGWPNGIPVNLYNHAGQYPNYLGIITNSGARDAGASEAIVEIDVNHGGGTWEIVSSPISVGILAPGQSQAVSFDTFANAINFAGSPWNPSLGLHQFRVRADYNNRIIEANEANNDTIRDFRVIHVDLTLQDVLVSPNAIVNRPITLSTRVRNIATSPPYIAYRNLLQMIDPTGNADYYHGRFIDQGTISSTTPFPGGTELLTHTYIPTTTGTYTFEWKTDAFQEELEINENNNVIQGSFTVSPAQNSLIIPLSLEPARYSRPTGITR